MSDQSSPIPIPEPSADPIRENIQDDEQTLPALQPPPYVPTDPYPDAKFMNQEFIASYTITTQPMTHPYVANADQAPVTFQNRNYYPPGVTTYSAEPNSGSTVLFHTAGYNDVPVVVTCVNCRKVVTSRIDFVSGGFTWLMCCFICIICPLFCWLIPFCIPGTKDVYHYCPECNQMMGVCKRM
uniref:lipopolysaccharide-induced tumor necrosis factor-alpha factor homolog n=1 Tax=Styela clava TaxID=7725 RepID=UPI0019392E52|nr:lipopolysaccharide-induced tumor necrosis factor-alpha factor homolog [Styela clava]XP_039265357.1 lipopolysaccharide-induced tumor necrosis factor-alpha factor homolog [Styela clava]